MRVIPLMLDRVPAPYHAQGAEAVAIFEILWRDFAGKLQRLILDYLYWTVPTLQEKKERCVQKIYARI
jgi:elongation factor P hydroxylase